MFFYDSVNLKSAQEFFFFLLGYVRFSCVLPPLLVTPFFFINHLPWTPRLSLWIQPDTKPLPIHCVFAGPVPPFFNNSYCFFPPPYPFKSQKEAVLLASSACIRCTFLVEREIPPPLTVLEVPLWANSMNFFLYKWTASGEAPVSLMVHGALCWWTSDIIWSRFVRSFFCGFATPLPFFLRARRTPFTKRFQTASLLCL